MNTQEEILKLKQAVNKIAKELANHSDGDGTNPHQLATEISNGLMSANAYRQAIGYGYKDNYIKDKYGSLWNMPVGTYATVYSFAEEVPVPDDMVAGDLITLRIIGEDNRRKTYVMIVQKTGSIYYLNTSQNTGSGGGNNNSTYWKRIPQETILWSKGSGTPASVGQNMNLIVKTRRFRRLRFFIEGLGTTFCCEVPAVDNPVLSISTVAGSIDQTYIVRLNITNYRDNEVLRFDKLRVTTLYTSGEISINDNDNGFKIQAIEGIY